MKKFDLRILYLIISISGLLFSNSVNAQTARAQWINNSAAVALDTIDIYMDGVKIADNLLFKAATSILTSNSGSHAININEASSADSGDLVISRNTITFSNNSNNTVMVAGVDVPSSYAANPNGRATDIQLVLKSGILLSTTSSANCALTLFFGVTDNEGLNINTRPTGTGINFTKSKFGDATASVTPSASSTLVDIMDTTGTILKTLVLPLNTFAKKSITIFNAGFVTPSANQNGELESFYLVDTNGGNATKISEISRVQFINNSADLILDSVDIWLNNNKVSGKLGFTAATNTFTVAKGIYDITVTKKNSPDTTGSNVVYRIPSFNFQTGKTYLGLISGVVNPSSYVANPDAVNTAFTLNMVSDNNEFASTTTVTNTRFFNAVTDAHQLAILRNPNTPVTLFGPTTYGTLTPATNINISAIQVLLENYNGAILKSYRLNLAGQGGKSAVISSVGFMDSVGNGSGSSSKLYKYVITFSDGTQATLIRLRSGKIQVIHASADATISKCKLFMNGVSIADSLSFRMATPFIVMDAYIPYRFHLAPLGAADTSTAFYNFNLLPDSSKSYYAIAVGLNNTTGYAVNPDGVDRSFSVLVNSSAKEKAGLNSKNIDLMYLNAMTDAPATTSKGIGQTLYLSKGDKYKAFHGYNAHSAFNNVLFELYNAYNNDLLLRNLGNLTEHKGLAGIAIASGFLNPSANNNGERARLFIIWPNGVTDSMPFTGLKQNTFNSSDIAVYPVPANNQVNLSINVNSNAFYTAEIIDLTGKTLLTQTDKLTKGNALISINTEVLTTGFYILRLTSGDQVFTKKINIAR